MTIIMYATPTCPWCAKLKLWLEKKNISYELKNVLEDDVAREELIQKSGQMGVPTCDIKGTIVVGFNEEKLKEAFKKHAIV